MSRWRARASTALLPAITLLGLGLRLVGLGERSIWSDETFSLNAARLPFDQLFLPRLIDNGNQLLFHVVGHVWVRLIPEFPPVNESLIRLLPLAFSVATIPVIYLLAKKTAAHVTPHTSAHAIGLIAAAFFALSPLAVTYGQEFRGYSLQVFLLALTSLTIMHALRGTERSGRWWATYTVLAALSVYSHFLSGFLVASQLAVAVLLTRRGEPPRPRITHVLLSAAAFSALIAPLVLTVVRRGATQISWVPPVTPQTVRDTAVSLAGGYDQGAGTFALAAPALIILLAGLIRLSTHARPWGARRLLLLAALLIPPALSILTSLLITSVWLVRYMQFMLIPVALLFAIGVTAIRDAASAPGRLGRAMKLTRVYVLLPLLATTLTLGSLHGALSRPAYEDWKGVASTLRTTCPEGEFLRVGLTRFPDWLRSNLSYYETQLDEIIKAHVKTDSAALPNIQPSKSLCLVRHWDGLSDASSSAYLRQIEILVGPLSSTPISFGPRAKPGSSPTLVFYRFESAP